MAKQDEGWVKLHRKIWHNPWMKNPSYLVVWIWVLTHAEYREEDDPDVGSYLLSGDRIKLRPGELTCGMKEIAKEIGTSRSTVVRAMNVFEKEGQIEQRANTKFTLITVKKWKEYQEKRTTGDTTSGQRVIQRADTYKEDKNTRREEYKNKEIDSIGESAVPLAASGKGAEPDYKKKINPEVSALIGYLQETLGLSKLDRSVQQNRRMSYLAIQKFGFEQAKVMILLASQDDYWKSRVTSMNDIYYNGMKIASTKRFAPKGAIQSL